MNESPTPSEQKWEHRFIDGPDTSWHPGRLTNLDMSVKLVYDERRIEDKQPAPAEGTEWSIVKTSQNRCRLYEGNKFLLDIDLILGSATITGKEIELIRRAPLLEERNAELEKQNKELVLELMEYEDELKSKIERLEERNRELERTIKEMLGAMKTAETLLFRMEFGGDMVNKSDFYKSFESLITKVEGRGEGAETKEP